MSKSIHAFIESAPCRGICASPIYPQREADAVYALFKAAGVTDWLRHIYQVQPLPEAIYVARVTRYGDPTWKRGRDFWLVLYDGKIVFNEPVPKKTLTALLVDVYTQIGAALDAKQVAS